MPLSLPPHLRSLLSAPSPRLSPLVSDAREREKQGESSVLVTTGQVLRLFTLFSLSRARADDSLVSSVDRRA